MVRAVKGALLLMALVADGAFADDTPALGLDVTDEEIRRIDIDVMPDGRGLPPGEGRVAVGAEIYGSKCEACHGVRGHGGASGSLAGEPLHSPADLAGDRSLKKTVGNYWPHATTLFDYIRRAMPQDAPGSLTDTEVYHLTAYILHLNGLLTESEVLDQESLPGIEMPARRYFKSAASGAPVNE